MAQASASKGSRKLNHNHFFGFSITKIDITWLLVAHKNRMRDLLNLVNSPVLLKGVKKMPLNFVCPNMSAVMVSDNTDVESLIYLY